MGDRMAFPCLWVREACAAYDPSALCKEHVGQAAVKANVGSLLIRSLYLNVGTQRAGMLVPGINLVLIVCFVAA